MSMDTQKWNSVILPVNLAYRLRVYAVSQESTDTKVATEVLTQFLEECERKGKPTTVNGLLGKKIVLR